MYATPAARESRNEVLLEAIRKIQLAAVVLGNSDSLTATHVPVTIRREGERLYLDSHVARSNPMWRQAAQGCAALAIVQGPQSYIHPGWMPISRASGKAVPTWAYVAVHAHGTIRVVEDTTWVRRHLDELAAENEEGRAEAWSLSEVPAEYARSLLNGIVGLQLTVERMEGNWKLAQGLPKTDRLGVIDGLFSSGDPAKFAVAEEMQRLMAINDKPAAIDIGAATDDLTGLTTLVRQSWSDLTASTYSPSNPALGQCSVTALVIQDELGGEILKTKVNGAWHFYNSIEGSRIDVTACQFLEPISYDDLTSSREEAFADTTSMQYQALKASISLSKKIGR